METDQRLLSKADIEQALSTLADELGEGADVELFVVGGGALALAHDARRTTRDVDAVVLGPDPDLVLAAAKRVAASLGLPSRWLNDDVKRFVTRAGAGPVVFRRKRLLVRAAPAEQLLAMKLAAWRDELDIADARLLLSKLAGDMEAVWSQIGGTLGADARAQARYNFEDLWEDVHGPA